MMTPEITNEVASELDRLEALLKWWGAPGIDYESFTQAHLKRFEAIVAELERAAVEISANQEKALTRSQELLIKSMPVFVDGHDLNDVMAAQSKILLSLLDVASTQAKTWMTFSDKIRNAQLALVEQPIDEEEAENAPSPSGHTKKTG